MEGFHVFFLFFRAEAAASKWWFYIYSLVESFTAKRTESSTQELVKTFQKFMEQSTLGEYEARLNILFTFHCHVVHMQQTVHRGEVMILGFCVAETAKCSESCSGWQQL
jgi:midasin